MIIKNIIYLIFSGTAGLMYSQVGIGTSIPSATLDVVSKGNTSATKALEINNSTGTEILTLLDNGRLGIRTSAPNANLEVIGNVDFPTVASTPAIAPFNTLGINQISGSVGTFVPATRTQPIFVISNSTASNALTYSSGAPDLIVYESYTPSQSINLDFGTTPILNTAGITVGQDTGINLSDGTSNATLSYFQVSQPGIYKVEISGTFRCNDFHNVSGTFFLTNMSMWKAPATTSYSIYDDYRITNLFGDGSQFATPFTQSVLLQLNSGDKIAFRIYRSGAATNWDNPQTCRVQLPTAGNQQDAKKLIITKL
jgi:hypothetical protein